MKGLLLKLFLVLAVLSISQVGSATLVTKIVIEQVSGVSADFDAAAGDLYFTGGAAGFMVTELGDFISFVNGTVIGEFYGCADTSSGGVASASFNDGFLSMHLDGAGGAGQYVDMAISLKGYYTENETTAASDATTHLNGMALVTVDQADFSDGWLGGGLTYQWADAIGEDSGLITETTMSYGINIANFLGNYSTNNTIITLFADEGAVPEPMTLVLLGAGAFLVRRSKRC